LLRSDTWCCKTKFNDMNSNIFIQIVFWNFLQQHIDKMIFWENFHKRPLRMKCENFSFIWIKIVIRYFPKYGQIMNGKFSRCRHHHHYGWNIRGDLLRHVCLLKMDINVIHDITSLLTKSSTRNNQRFVQILNMWNTLTFFRAFCEMLH
jgi:hypothetical protein